MKLCRVRLPMFVKPGEEFLTMTLPTNEQRRVLLIDQDSHRQRLRTVALRNLGVEVQPASCVEDAAKFCTRRPYGLVLLAADENSQETVLLSNEVRKIWPGQRIAVFVGAPEYIREFGRQAPAGRTEKQRRPQVLLTTAESRSNQWQVTLRYLLAAG